MNGMRFENRRAAGRALAAALTRLAAEEGALADPVILALPRGGVPVAVEVARALSAPLDLVIVRKIGVPFQPELAAAAIVDGPEADMVVNRDVIAMTGMSGAELEAGRKAQLAEIARRRQAYLGDRAAVPVEGRDVIVVDDGVATGATIRAALIAIRRRRPRSLTLAVPVAPQDELDALAGEVDRLLCLETPSPFLAIGAHYDRFEQTSDAEVVRLLAEADRERAGGGG